MGFIRAHKKKCGIELQKLKAMQNLKDYHDICPGLAADFAVEKKTETGNASIIETNYISILSLIKQRVNLKVGRVDVTLTKWSGVHKINEN